MIPLERMVSEGRALREISRVVLARKKIDDPDFELKGVLLQLNASLWEVGAEISERLERLVPRA